MKKTQRGFSIYSEGKDSYGAEVDIQMSSAVNKRCWIKIKGGALDNNDGTAHITEGHAKRIIKALEKFIADD